MNRLHTDLVARFQADGHPIDEILDRINEVPLRRVERGHFDRIVLERVASEPHERLAERMYRAEVERLKALPAYMRDPRCREGYEP